MDLTGTSPADERGRYRPADGADGALPRVPLVVATTLRPEGITGVHTHFTQLLAHLAGTATGTATGAGATLLTPFSWGGPLRVPVFGARFALDRVSPAAGVAWYRAGHEAFLRRALRRYLRSHGDCVVYAQCPLSARAALRERLGPHQRVVLAVHFRVSQADEWADKGLVPRDGRVFRGIRDLERAVLPRVDGLVYVSRWAREAVLDWLPEAAAVPSAVVDNFVTPYEPATPPGPLADLVTVGNLETVKNHRYLLEVLAASGARGRRVSLDVYGEGPERADLERRARQLGVADLVRWHGFRRDVRDRLPGYRLYVHASYSESSSLAIMEAMAAGLPVVAGDTGPLTELFDDGVEGRLWPLDDAAAAAGVLLGLLDDEPARERAAQAARDRFARDFTAAAVAPRLLDFVLGVPARGR